MNATSLSATPLRVRIADSAAELEAVYQFRYQIYVDEMQRIQHYADHERKMIIDPLDTDAINFAAWNGDRVVGVIRANLARQGSLGLYESLYDMGALGSDHPLRTSIATRFMVEPELRRTGLPMRLVLLMYDYGLLHGVRWNVMDCNDHLIPLFHGIGYRQHVEPRDHPEYGTVNIMRLDMHDEAYLRTVGSPYFPRLAHFVRTTQLHGQKEPA